MNEQHEHQWLQITDLPTVSRYECVLCDDQYEARTMRWSDGTIIRFLKSSPPGLVITSQWAKSSENA